MDKNSELDASTSLPGDEQNDEISVNHKSRVKLKITKPHQASDLGSLRKHPLRTGEIPHRTTLDTRYDK